MLGRTHLLTGFFVGLLLVSFFSISNIFSASIIVALSLFGSLFPDIDSPNSYLGRNVKIFGYLFKHRGFFHSLFCLVILYFLLEGVIGFKYAVAFGAGFLSHLILDTLTLDGLHVFPLKKKIKGPIKVGGIAEHIFVVLQLILIVFLFL